MEGATWLTGGVAIILTVGVSAVVVLGFLRDWQVRRRLRRVKDVLEERGLWPDIWREANKK